MVYILGAAGNDLHWHMIFFSMFEIPHAKAYFFPCFIKAFQIKRSVYISYFYLVSGVDSILGLIDAHLQPVRVRNGNIDKPVLGIAHIRNEIIIALSNGRIICNDDGATSQLGLDQAKRGHHHRCPNYYEKR